METQKERRAALRERLVRVAAELLTQGGREAVSTRAISAAAGIQPPTLYRQFGDLQGLLDEVARTTFAQYLRQKITRPETDDPVTELRQGWDVHVAFGLAHPAVYTLIYGSPTAGVRSPAAEDGLAILDRLVTRVAQAGRLRVSVSQAVGLIAAAGEGVTLTLIASAPDERDLQLSRALREAVLAAVLTSAPAAPEHGSGAEQAAALAVALRARLLELPAGLSAAERQLLSEWLGRLATAAREDGPAASPAADGT